MGIPVKKTGLWEWLGERAQMPRFVWFGVLLILIAIAYQIFTARSLIINLRERSLEVEKAEAEVAVRREKVIEVADSTIAELEKLKAVAPPPEREKFTAAQTTIREDVKNPLLDKKVPPHLEEFIKSLREAKK